MGEGMRKGPLSSVDTTCREMLEFLARTFPVACASDEFFYFPQVRLDERQWGTWDRFSEETVDECARRLTAWEIELDRLKSDHPDLDVQIDITLHQRLSCTLREQLTEVRTWQTQPTFYLTLACVGLAEAMGMLWPASWGPPPLQWLAAGLIGSFYISQPPILRLGSQELKERILPDTIAGNRIGALCITEPSAGSDVAQIRTQAIRDGDDYIVNGSKTFITSGMRADVLTVAVRTGGDGASVSARDVLGYGRAVFLPSAHTSPYIRVSFSIFCVDSKKHEGHETRRPCIFR